MKYKFKVPSGIGDFSWIYSKLVNFPHDFEIAVCSEGPHRTLPFVELLPKVSMASYEMFSYHKVFVVRKAGLSPETDILELEPGEYYVSANPWLEAGNHVSTFFPTLEANYHYDFRDLSMYEKSYDFKGKVIGVYTSKYLNYAGDFAFWTTAEWVFFLDRIRRKVPGDCTFVFIGADFDNDMGNHVEAKVKEFAHTVNLIGKTHIGEVICLLKKLDYLFAFPSGIGVLGDVVNTPTMHFIPKQRLSLLVNTYADPESVASDRHVCQLFCSPEEAYQVFRKKGAKYLCA